MTSRFRPVMRPRFGLPALLLALVALLFAPFAAVAAPLAGTVIGNQAAATYSDGSATTRSVTSNLVTTIVQQVGSVALTANSAKTVSPGGQVV